MTEAQYHPARVWLEEAPSVGMHAPANAEALSVGTQFTGLIYGPLLGAPSDHLPNLELMAVIDALMTRLMRTLRPIHPSQASEAGAAIYRACVTWKDTAEYWGWLSAYTQGRRTM